jgi:hypothetical protein
LPSHIIEVRKNVHLTEGISWLILKSHVTHLPFISLSTPQTIIVIIVSREADAPNLSVCKELSLRSKFNYSGILCSRHPPLELSRVFIILLVLLKLDLLLT